jgi:hypothetical protein
MKAKMEAWLEEMKACSEVMEACLGKTEVRINASQEQMRA